MTEENKPEPKISGVEAFLIIGLAFAFDAADFFATLLDGFFGMGELIKIFINVIASVTLWLWAMIKEVGPERILAGSLLEFIPVINILPMRTVAAGMTVWLDWHPEQAELVAKNLPAIKTPRRVPVKKALAEKPPKTNQAA